MHNCAILAFYQYSDHWTIEYNEVASNYAGIIFPSDSSVRNNFIHHNYNLGYQADAAHNSIIENNEISYNGYEQKIMQSSNVTFRGNFIHHNEGPGIWYDANNTGALIENNLIEDNRSEGIFYEISGGATIRSNTIRRSGDTGIFISTSRNNQIYNNTLEDNFRAITYLVNCPSVGGGTIYPPEGFDLKNNAAHDNTIVVGTQSGAFASALAAYDPINNCRSGQLDPYLLPPNQTGSKNNAFIHNSYDVPDAGNVKYFYFFDIMKFWPDWQALGQDTTGTIK
jgi:parallel beta-helix repeat protein